MVYMYYMMMRILVVLIVRYKPCYPVHNILPPFCLCTVGTNSSTTTSSSSSSLHLHSATSSQLLASSTVHCKERRIVNGLHVLHDSYLSSTYRTVQTMLSGAASYVLPITERSIRAIPYDCELRSYRTEQV